ncbi:MAG: sialate O-acetylesterase [Candidatus Hydrogenedentes bacterium]|nr:sialate O-acetylesterase [Candidatus Hydrogenedentota bacterium]
MIRSMLTVCAAVCLAATVAFAQDLPQMTLERGVVANQVVQANAEGTAKVTAGGGWNQDGPGLVSARVIKDGEPLLPWAEAGRASDGIWDGALPGVPVGGPYQIEWLITKPDKSVETVLTVENVFVGDVWLLAGQSNMQGVGNMINVTEPDPRIMLFAMDRKWRPAKEPIHNLEESPDIVHFNPEKQERTAAIEAKITGPKGAGLGMPFAKAMLDRTGRPQGLIATAHGGTSMDQWNPELRDKGGESLYGSMYQSFLAAGGDVRGILWYQGESDASPEASRVYLEKMKNLVAAMREDFRRPNLPFLMVQIGRFVIPEGDAMSWSKIRQLELQASQEIPNTGIVPAIDLRLDDLIHVGTAGLKVLGHRLANEAMRLVYGAELAGGPRLVKMTREQTAYGLQVRCTFEGVNGGLTAPGRVWGFDISSGAENPPTPCIYDQEIDPNDPNTIILWLTKMPDDPHLWYGYGLNPYCNIVDQENMAMPAFGPVAIP